MAESVLMVQGATNMPRWRKEPLATAAPTSAHLVNLLGHGPYLLHRVVRLDGQVAGSGFAKDQVAGMPKIPKHPERLHPVDDPAGSADAQH